MSIDGGMRQTQTRLMSPHGGALIDRRAGKQVEGRKGNREVYEKSPEIRHLRVSPYREEAEPPLPWAAGVARRRGKAQEAPRRAVRVP
jgi:hypothetical protein